MGRFADKLRPKIRPISGLEIFGQAIAIKKI